MAGAQIAPHGRADAADAVRGADHGDGGRLEQAIKVTNAHGFARSFCVGNGEPGDAYRRTGRRECTRFLARCIMAQSPTWAAGRTQQPCHSPPGGTSLKDTKLNELGASEAVALLARRELVAVDLACACLERIAEREKAVQAFAYIDPDDVLRQARALDAGPVRGLLHGLPLGVKDLFDTAAVPTAYGSMVYAGHHPVADAAAVALCREAGALLMGKTVTTEFAYFHPGSTRNPHNTAHTPGGSSSGSAAAVADRMLPLALGTQTAGSIIRPAAYCGVVGYKPSAGRVPRAGVKSLSETLDTVGGFGRSVADVALLGAVLTGDERLREVAPVAAPRIGLCATPHWEAADEDTRAAWSRAATALRPHGAGLVDLALPADLPDLVAVQKAVMAFEMARTLSHERLMHRDRLSPRLGALLDEGMAIAGATHAANLALTALARRRVDALFEGVDALLTPSTIGEAPEGIAATGDPLFCRGWTLLGLPCVHLPFTTGRLGLPVGLQLVGRFGEDHRLLTVAQWAHQRLSD
ncbi:MAG: amidase [Rhizobacter sp.]